MNRIDTKVIEEKAATYLKQILLDCRFITSKVRMNDRTQSWDGEIIVYSSETHEKGSIVLDGRIPIQVKGTTNPRKHKNLNIISYPCDIKDIKNYHNDRGCICFIGTVSRQNGKIKLYYKILHIHETFNILKNHGKQKTFSIKCEEFPYKDEKKMMIIFHSFIKDRLKQTPWVGKNIPNYEELINQKLIESLSFNIPIHRTNCYDINDILINRSVFLYATLYGNQYDVPIGSFVINALYKEIDTKIGINNKIYYNNFTEITDNGSTKIKFGKGIYLTQEIGNRQINIQFKPTGTLDDYIFDTSFLIDLEKYRHLQINNITLNIHTMKVFHYEELNNELKYYLDVKLALEKLGVKTKLIYSELTDNEHELLYNIVMSVVYNNDVIPNGKHSSCECCFIDIGNLKIMIWIKRTKENFYKIINYFEHIDFIFAYYDKTDTLKKNPIILPHFFLLKRDLISKLSNINFDFIYDEISSLDCNDYVYHESVNLMLEVIYAYDMQKTKDIELLLFSERLCKWIIETYAEKDHEFMTINKMQIKKRQLGKLDWDDIAEITPLIAPNKSLSVRCGARILLGDAKAQECFDQMSDDEQRTFLTYPICNLGNLKRRNIEEPSNGQNEAANP